MRSTDQASGLLAQIQGGAIPWSQLARVVAAILLGVVLVYGAGVAGADVLHNAAHDARHGLSFPCH